MQDRKVVQESNDPACKEGIKELLRWTEEMTDKAQHPKEIKEREEKVIWKIYCRRIS